MIAEAINVLITMINIPSFYIKSICFLTRFDITLSGRCVALLDLDDDDPDIGQLLCNIMRCFYCTD